MRGKNDQRISLRLRRRAGGLGNGEFFKNLGDGFFQFAAIVFAEAEFDAIEAAKSLSSLIDEAKVLPVFREKRSKFNPKNSDFLVESIHFDGILQFAFFRRKQDLRVKTVFASILIAGLSATFTFDKTVHCGYLRKKLQAASYKLQATSTKH